MIIDPPDTTCMGEIKANPDIGGPGVMVSFLIVSWITVLLGVFPALHEAHTALNQWRSHRLPTQTYKNEEVGVTAIQPKQDRPRLRATHSQTAEQEPSIPEPKLVQKVNALFRPLCDLQIVTSMSIMVAGQTQWHSITHYHAELIMSYWWLTMDSFFVGRHYFRKLESDGDCWPIRVRGVSILVSCILATIWGIRYIYRDQRYWDDTNGPCYRFLDGTSDWPWIVGLVVFSIALSSHVFRGARFVSHLYVHCTERARKGLSEWLENSLQRSEGIGENDTGQQDPDIGKATTILHGPRARPGILDVMHKIMRHIEVAIAALAVSIYWAFLQWLAIWSYGDAFYPFTWVISVGFNVWSSFDVISLWMLNKSQISAEEQAWGFGQVLPVVLTLLIGINAVDIFREDYPQHPTKASRQSS